MIITKEHALLLKEIYEGKLRGDEFYSKADKEPEVLEYLNQLYLMDLLRLEDIDKYHLTYPGILIAETLLEMEKKGKIPRISDWESGFRWLGSEIISMIDVSRKCQGVCPPDAVKPLEIRGFARNGQLTPYADVVWQAYQEAQPHITVDKRLTIYIQQMPPGPGLKSILKLTAEVGKHELFELEAQRLIAFSAPNSDVFTLTGLGQQIRLGLLKSAPALPINVSAEILENLAKVVTQGKNSVDEKTFEMLLSQGYINDKGELLPGGRHLYLAWKMYNKEINSEPWSVDFDEIEIEILKAIEKIWEKHQSNPAVYPTKEEIWKFVFERKVKEAKNLLARYGRKLKELPKKKQELLKELEEAKKIEDWFNKYYDISTALFSLEAQSAIVTKLNEKGQIYYDFTDFGKQILKDQKEIREREIHAYSVKAITVTRLKDFHVPDYSWFLKAEEEGLVGKGAPTTSGEFYARMATYITRIPHLTAFELKVLKVIPYTRGTLIKEEIIKPYFPDKEEEVYLALEKLDAKGVVNLETCGVVTLTEAGKLIKRATAGTPEGIANPVNPWTIKILEAIKKVGTLYVKDRKIRIEPENWKQIKKLSGLSEEEIEKQLVVMKQARFLGENSLFESGLLLLEAAELMIAKDRFWESA